MTAVRMLLLSLRLVCGQTKRIWPTGRRAIATNIICQGLSGLISIRKMSPRSGHAPLIFADSAAVFDALKTQGFPTEAIRCLQRKPSGDMLITFANACVKDAFVEKNVMQICDRRFAINDHDKFLTYLNIYDAPHELSDNALICRLEPYCEVVSYRRGRYLNNKSVFNGNRHYRVRIHASVPSYLRFGKFLVRLS